MAKLVLTEARHETINFISDKTGLSDPIVKLIIDFFSFAIKKVLIERGRIHIWTLGTFTLKILRRKDRIRLYEVFFSACDDFKENLKNKRPACFYIKQAYVLRPKFKQVARLLGINLKDVRYLFALYTYCIVINLLKYKEYRIPRFGKLLIVDAPHLKLSGISKKNIGEINTKIVIFKFSQYGKYDINRWRRTISVCKRLKRMFYFSKTDISLPTRPCYLKDNDMPQAKLRKR